MIDSLGFLLTTLFSHVTVSVLPFGQPIMSKIVPFSQVTAVEEDGRVILVHKKTGKAFVNQTELARWCETSRSTIGHFYSDTRSLPQDLKALLGKESLLTQRFENPNSPEPWHCVDVDDAYVVLHYRACIAKGWEDRIHARTLLFEMGRAGATVYAYKRCGYKVTATESENIPVDHFVLALPDAWVKRFPDNWFLEAERLTGYPKQSAVMAKFIKKVIYSIMPNPVLEKLDESNPVTESGHRKHKFHQFLQNEALDFLEERIRLTYPLIKASQSTKQFYQLLKAYDTPTLKGGN